MSFRIILDDDQYLADLDWTRGKKTRLQRSDKPRRKTEQEKELRLLERDQNKSLLRDYKRGRLNACCLRYRLKEQARLCRILSKHEPDSPILKRLINCRKSNPSNLPFSVRQRAETEQRVFQIAMRQYLDVEHGEMHFGTIILSVHYGKLHDLYRKIKAQIHKFRRKIRNHRATQAKEHDWYNDISVIGYFEIEPYHRQHMKEMRQHADLLDEKNTIDAEDVSGLPPGPSRKEAKQLRKKVNLMNELGFDTSKGSVFYVLHIHFIANLSDPKSYSGEMKRIFPGADRVHIKRFYRGKAGKFGNIVELTKNQNVRSLIGYMLKVSPCYGRRIHSAAKKTLSEMTALKFVKLYALLGFGGIKFHLNLRRIGTTHSKEMA